LWDIDSRPQDGGSSTPSPKRRESKTGEVKEERLSPQTRTCLENKFDNTPALTTMCPRKSNKEKEVGCGCVWTVRRR
ncbi:hypothetical protein BaRGS_00013337, partial [Batillaria attramentaria]